MNETNRPQPRPQARPVAPSAPVERRPVDISTLAAELFEIRKLLSRQIKEQNAQRLGLCYVGMFLLAGGIGLCLLGSVNNADGVVGAGLIISSMGLILAMR